MPDLDLKPSEPKPPDRLLVICTLVAAAILIPLGIWLKANDPLHIADWLRSIGFH